MATISQAFGLTPGWLMNQAFGLTRGWLTGAGLTNSLTFAAMA
jgi:hypothetical protein